MIEPHASEFNPVKRLGLLILAYLTGCSWGPNGLFWGLGSGSKNTLGYPHIVLQLLFSMFPSILTFDFDLILGSFLTSLRP